MNDWTIQNIENLIGQTLINKEIPDEYLMQKWEEQSPISNNSMHLYYHLFYRIAKELQPQTVVELGGWRGLAAAHFASGNPDCKVITIDHHSDPGDEKHYKAMLEMCDHFYNIEYLKGWTWDVFPEVKKMTQSIDVLFIDGWHQYDYAMKDWNLYSPLLSNGALVICDDLIQQNGPVISGMQRFWIEVSNGYEKYITEKDSEIHLGYPMGFFKYER